MGGVWGRYLGGSRWPTRLGRWHLLFGLQLHGFEPCKQHQRKLDVGMTPCTEGAPMVHQDLSGRPADQS